MVSSQLSGTIEGLDVDLAGLKVQHGGVSHA